MPNRFELDQQREAAETYTPSSAITVQAIGSGETGFAIDDATCTKGVCRGLRVDVFVLLLLE